MDKKTVLYIEFDSIIKNCSDLLENYKDRIKKHNTSLIEDMYPDSGFDILMPKDIDDLYKFKQNEIKLIPLGLKCAAYTFPNCGLYPQNYKLVQTLFQKGLRNGKTIPQPFTVHPRSSIWKSKFTLANNTGIIDSGYRGTLFGAFQNTSSNNEIISGNRYLQICMPDLQPFYVQVVDKIEVDSIRGGGGIGSTGL
jgi:dUTPase